MGRKKTSDALEALDRMHADDPMWRKMVEEETLKARIAQVVYALREESGKTQAHFAELVGIHRTDISKLENADYEGSALEMLWRICSSLGKPFEICYTGRKVTCKVRGQRQRAA